MKQEYSFKITPLVCLITCITLSGCAFVGKRQPPESPFIKGEALENADIKNVAQLETRKGYLAGGPTIKVETDTPEYAGTIIEQFERTSKELQESKEQISSKEKEVEELKTSKAILQAELKGANEKLTIAQQMFIENEALADTVVRLKMDLSALESQVNQLNEDLLVAQISEIKTKQELVSARIQHLQEKGGKK